MTILMRSMLVTMIALLHKTVYCRLQVLHVLLHCLKDVLFLPDQIFARLSNNDPISAARANVRNGAVDPGHVDTLRAKLGSCLVIIVNALIIAVHDVALVALERVVAEALCARKAPTPKLEAQQPYPDALGLYRGIDDINRPLEIIILVAKYADVHVHHNHTEDKNEHRAEYAEVPMHARIIVLHLVDLRSYEGAITICHVHMACHRRIHTLKLKEIEISQNVQAEHAEETDHASGQVAIPVNLKRVQGKWKRVVHMRRHDYEEHLEHQELQGVCGDHGPKRWQNGEARGLPG